MNAGNLDLKESLELLVIDEADLVFSFGYEDDVKGKIHVCLFFKTSKKEYYLKTLLRMGGP